MKWRILKIACLLGIVGSFVDCLKISESINKLSGDSATVYDMSQFIGSFKKITVSGWVGVSPVNSCFLGLHSASEQIQLCSQSAIGITILFIRSKTGASSNAGSLSTIVESKLWCRFAISVSETSQSTSALLFVEKTFSSVTSGFISGDSVNLLIGVSDPAALTVAQNVTFYSLAVYDLFLNSGQATYVANSLFEFSPIPKIIVQLYKHANYSSSFVNLVADGMDIDNRRDTDLNTFNNIHNSFDILENGLKLPAIVNSQFKVDQSYVIFISLELYVASAVTKAFFNDIDVNVYTRTTATSTLVLKSHFFLHYYTLLLPHLPYGDISLKLYAASSDNTIQSIAMTANNNAVACLGFRYHIVKVIKTIYDYRTSIQQYSNFFNDCVNDFNITIGSTDQHFVRD